MLGEYDNGSALGKGRTEYIWLPLPDGGVVPVGFYRNGKFFSVHADHLGTPRLVRNEAGEPVWQWPYSGFGNNKPSGVLKATPNPKAALTNQPFLLKATAATEFNLRFPGQYFDSETGTMQNYWRDYDANLGGYRQADPIGLGGGWNRYTYVDGSPLNFADPTGLLFESTLGGLRRNTTLDQAATYGASGNAAAAMGLGGAVGGAAAAGAGAAYMTYVPAPARTAIGLLKGLGDDAIPPPTAPQPPLLTPPAIIRPGGFNPPAPPPGFCPRP